MNKDDIILKAGLQFESKTFFDTAEVVRIDENTDTIEIRRIPSDGHAYVVDWPLQATKERFKEGFYFLSEPIPFNITTS